jgi:aryl-alcohol dehydrogenase-like predicted oxidoreductase
MEQTRLGATGLKISRLALGCMSYGDPTTERAHEWALADDEAQPFFRQAIELGITFWDTANVYQAGTSEEVVGRAIERYARREDIVLATKVHGKMHDGPGGSGLLSRKAILEQIEASLTRLGTDYVTCTRFTASTRTRRSRRRWKRCIKWSKRGRSGI